MICSNIHSGISTCRMLEVDIRSLPVSCKVAYWLLELATWAHVFFQTFTVLQKYEVSASLLPASFRTLDASGTLQTLQSISKHVYLSTCTEIHFLFYVQNAIRMSVFNPQSQKQPQNQNLKKAVVAPRNLNVMLT